MTQQADDTDHEVRKMRIALDMPASEALLMQLEEQALQLCSPKEGDAERPSWANARIMVRNEVDALMSLSLQEPEAAEDPQWHQQKAETIRKAFPNAADELVAAYSTTLQKLLAILGESLFAPDPKVDQTTIEKNIRLALKEPTAKNIITKMKQVRTDIYMACNPTMDRKRVAVPFAQADIYEKLDNVVAELVKVVNPKYTIHFYQFDRSLHFHNLKNAFPQASDDLCIAYVQLWKQLEDILVEAHGGYYTR